MKSIFILLIIFSSTIQSKLYSQTLPDNLKINQVQMIGSHNSYKTAIEPALWDSLKKILPISELQKIEYKHISLTDQLNLGIRNLEIDIYSDSLGGYYAHPKALVLAKPESLYDPKGEMQKPGLKVLHIQDIDVRSHDLTFSDCLEEINVWSTRHPNHFPIFINIEPKDTYDPNVFGHVPEHFSNNALSELDKTIIEIIRRKSIITPEDIKGKYSTLNEAVLHNNWPTIDSAKGKLIFLMDNHAVIRDMYKKLHPFLNKQILLTDEVPGDKDAAICILNNPFNSDISSLVKQGYIIRTRADENTMQARKNDFSSFSQAEKSGAQIISTDYYLKSTFFKSAYSVKFKNDTYLRKNIMN